MKIIFTVKDTEVIHNNFLGARNLTSNAGSFLLLENAKVYWIHNLIKTGLVFDRPSTNKFKMNHNKTMLCDH